MEFNHKKCSKCFKLKSINKYHKKSNKKNLYKSECKKCSSKYGHQYRLKRQQEYLDFPPRA